MNFERHSEIKKLFDAAAKINPSERENFLVKSCGGDDELRREVENLLTSQEHVEKISRQSADGAAVETLSAAENTLQIGECFSRYRISALIGAGGMGEVFLAEDIELERPTAIKILPAGFAADGDRVRRFIQEAKSISALNHPNILTIYEIGEHRGSRFMASEFVKGGTLREIMRRRTFTLAEVFDIARQISAALNAAHEAGIVHRDIKPENIMLREDNLIKVLDFGLAKLTEQKSKSLDLEAETAAQINTHIGMIMGTALYMSPEQARGKPVDARTDLWSLGVILYEMLAGNPPFTGETLNDIIASVLTKEPNVFDDSKTYIPAELKKIVVKLLQKERADRYRTAKDLLSDLQKLQKSVEANPPTESLPVSTGLENDTTIIQPLKTNPSENEIGGAPENQKFNRQKFVYGGLAFCSLLAIAAFIVWSNASETGKPNDIFSADVSTISKPSVKFYWAMNETEQLTFVRERARHIQTLIGDAPVEFDEEAVRAIKAEIDTYVKKRNSLSQKPFDEGLRVIYGRASQFAPTIIRAYQARQIPPALGIYQAMIESEYHDCLVSGVGSVGLFQFVPATAKRYGLTKKDYCNVEKQSEAAARFMSDLMSDFDGNKSLALMSFNVGENGLRDSLRQLRKRGVTERTVWAVRRNYRDLNPPMSEDYTGFHYVPKFFAAAIIGETPDAFELSTTPLTTLREKIN